MLRHVRAETEHVREVMHTQHGSLLFLHFSITLVFIYIFIQNKLACQEYVAMLPYLASVLVVPSLVSQTVVTNTLTSFC